MDTQKHLPLGRRNQVTIPAGMLPADTHFFLCERQEDGSLVLTPQTTIPASQAYFWSKQWQEGEKTASRHIREGKTRQFASSKALFKEMDKRRKKA